MHRSIRAALTLAVIAAFLGAVESPAAAVEVDRGRVAEAADYASLSYGDPWDYANPEDQSTTPAVRNDRLTAMAVVNGRFIADAQPQGNIMLLDSWDSDVDGHSGLPWGRDGKLHPIDAGRFTRMSFRLWVDPAAGGQLGVVRWFDCGALIGSCAGQRGFTLVGGWNTYDVGLVAEAGGRPWAGQVKGMQLVFSTVSTHVELDWTRIYQPDASLRPTVSASPGSTVYWDADTNPANNVANSPDWGVVGAAPNGTVAFPADAYPPGTYHFFAGAAAPQYSSAFTIDARPRPVVLDPDVAGGDDYATIVRGDAWDFSQASDVGATRNTSASVSGGQVHGVNTGPVLSDPGFHLPIAGPVDATTWHRLSARVWYDGGFSLSGAPGGGMNARLSWYLAGTNSAGVSEDIVVYPGWNDIALDLNTFPSGAVNDGGAGIGWLDRTIDRLRFDPHEDAGPRNWKVDEIRLARDDRGLDGFDIRYQDSAWEPGTVATFYRDTDNAGFDGVKIGTQTVGAGVNTFRWHATDADFGHWYVYVVLTDPAGTQSAGYSTGPVDIVPGAFDSEPSRFVPLPPARILDTREGLGAPNALVGANGAIDVQVAGVGGVPPDAIAAVLNVTATEAVAPGFITAWPSGYDRPNASNLNLNYPNQTIPNLVTVPVGVGGKVSLFTQSGAHLVADVAGYYVPAASSRDGRFMPLTPTRILDTRDGTGGFSGLVPQESEVVLQVTGAGGVPPSGVSGVVLNVTATGALDRGFVTVYPDGQPRPNASNLNLDYLGQTIPNQVIVPVGPDGKIRLYALRPVHLIADVAGWFTDGTAATDDAGLFVPLNPARLLDTRFGNGAPAALIGPGGQVTADFSNRGGVPGSGVAAVAMNTTATEALDKGFVTAFPAAVPRPLASNLNVEWPGQTIPNHTIVPTSGGQVSLYTQSGAHLLTDVVGYFTG